MPRKPKPEADKTLPASTRLPASILAALERLALEDDRTTSYLIAKAVREYVERHEAHPRPRHSPR